VGAFKRKNETLEDTFSMLYHKFHSKVIWPFDLFANCFNNQKPFFDHKLCFKSLHVEFNHVLNIYLKKLFKWFKGGTLNFFGTPWNSNSQFTNWLSFGSVWDSLSYLTLSYIFTHMWECVWILGHSFTLLSFSCLGIGHDWRTPKSWGEPTSGVHQSVVAESWDSEGAPDFQH
jgi:hypothetical protein